MEKSINLYFSMGFTSLSPDAQIISLGIVSDEQARLYDTRYTKHHLVAVKANMDEFERVGESEIYIKKTGYNEDSQSKSFYAEFSDFQLERCDKWVKENVVKKTSIGAAHLQTGEPITNNGAHYHSRNDTATCMGNTTQIKKWLKLWLKQFSDYQLQFVCDCGTYDFYWLVQLLDERVKHPLTLVLDKDNIPDGVTIEEIIEKFKKTSGIVVLDMKKVEYKQWYQTGLPKLPDNISPIPEDLNDLIAFKKGISHKEAFDLNREELMPANEDGSTWGWGRDKHNAMSDAILIKEIYQKLK